LVPKRANGTQIGANDGWDADVRSRVGTERNDCLVVERIVTADDHRVYGWDIATNGQCVGTEASVRPIGDDDDRADLATGVIR
jgi:hypothetical protein